MHSAFVSIVAQQQLLSQSGRHCRFEIAVAILIEIAAAILIGIAAAITPQTSLSSHTSCLNINPLGTSKVTGAAGNL